MFRKLQVAAILLCMLSYAAAGTVSIGTASARGDLRVDSYLVKGNATLFDGSVVETGQTTANLRLTPNEPNSRGVVSLKAGNTVEVASLNGSFGVTTNHGVLLANVRPGRVA